MLETFQKVDVALLLFFNGLHNTFLDFLFYWISDKFIWIPFYVWLAWLVFRSERKHFFFVLIFIALTITMSDQLASGLIKPLVMRLRPCHNNLISDRIHLVNNYCGGEFGFVSSHAANVFSLITFLSFLFNEKSHRFKKLLFVWATVVSFSRIYLGVHYPGDVLGGIVVGIFSGWVLFRLFDYFVRNYFLKKINS